MPCGERASEIADLMLKIVGKLSLLPKSHFLEGEVAGSGRDIAAPESPNYLLELFAVKTTRRILE
jgi:hypothetical protein